MFKAIYDVVLRRVECENDPSICSGLYCNATRTSRNSSSLDMGCYLKNPEDIIYVIFLII